MSNRLQVLIPEELDERIAKAAQRNRVSKGEFVRRALHLALEQGQSEAHGRQTDPVARLAALKAPTGGIDDMLAEIEAGRR